MSGVSATAVGCQASADRVAVLTFDDAVRSHREFVAPYLAQLGFGATFFVTHRWMEDSQNFMSWEEIAEISGMGFEIGNHSWSHPDFSVPRHAARLAGELALVENALRTVGVPKPTSFAWCGNHFGPEAVARLRELGYRCARRGLTPELPHNRALEPGPAYDPVLHDPLLIPSTGNSVPGITLELFREILARSSDGIVVLQFHGVPDIAHPWVHTPRELFVDMMQELKAQGFRVVALRDLEEIASGQVGRDPNVTRRNSSRPDAAELQPVELVQTRSDPEAWNPVMARHGYTVEEAAAVAGYTEQEAAAYRTQLKGTSAPAGDAPEVHPYPGGRHPRIGFLEGAVDPLRGTKASVFLPGEPESYVVVDLPELITSDRGHLFLAHTHVPTIWNARNVWIENRDWVRTVGGGLESRWELPNGVSFGASIQPSGGGVEMELWLHNGLDQQLTGLRTQLCVMLKGAPQFNAQTISNKVFREPVAAVRSLTGSEWILVAWERTGRSWGNERCPCLHADPVLPDCAPGRTVRIRGRLWFHSGESIEQQVASAARRYPALPDPPGTA